MTKEEKDATIAELKKIPQPVQFAVLFALALGLVSFVWLPLGAYAAHLPVGRVFVFALIMMFWFFVSGGSLYRRSRWGYLNGEGE